MLTFIIFHILGLSPNQTPKIRYQPPFWSVLSPVTIYKSFIRPHLDYADTIYDQPNNDSFKNKLERIQYNAALTVTGAIRGTSRDKTYKELGLEYLQSRRSLHSLCTFHKIKTSGLPSYLFKLIPDTSHHYFTRSVEKFLHINVEQKVLNHLFFHGPLLNEINQILKFKTCPAQLLKNI